MSTVFNPDFKGQKVKIAYPKDDSVYGSGAAYLKFNEKGDLQLARPATDTEVQWWMTLKQTEKLQESMDSLNERVLQLLQRAF